MMKFAHKFVLGLALVGLVGTAQMQAMADTPDAAVAAVAKGIADGQPQVLWTALPDKYQADVKGLLADYAAKMDKDVYEKSFAIMSKIVRVLREKKDFILGLPMLQQPGLVEKTNEIAQNWNGIVDMIDTLIQSDVKTLDGLKTLDPGQFLANTGAKFLGQAKQLISLMPDGEDKKKAMAKLDNMKNVKVTVVSTQSDAAVLKIEVPDEPSKEVPFKLVDGKWLPADLVDNWDKSIANAKQSLAGMDISKSKMQIMGMMGMVDAVLDQMLAAKTQQEFTMTIMQLAATFGGGGGPPGGPGGPGGQPGPGGPGGP